jgi:CCR4-NOT transcription complex subunit 6
VQSFRVCQRISTNASRYIVLDKQLIDFPQVGINRVDMKGEHDLFNRVMIRDNIGVVVFLENRLTGSRLIVVNTHLYWDQNYRDVKVVQAAILMEETQKLAEKYAKWAPTPDKDKIRFRYANGDKEGEDPEEEVVQEPVPSMSYERGTDIPIIVCGDFNSTPRSGVYEMLTTGQLPGNHKDLGVYKYGDLTKHGIRHAFGLKSSYGNIGELPFTNYTPGYTGVLDYILYSTSSLSCTGLLGEVDPDYLKRVPGFPNVHFPSDHLLLQSEFKSKSRKERKVTEVDFGPQKENRRS